MAAWSCPLTKVLIPLDKTSKSAEAVNLLARLLKTPRLRNCVERITILYVLKAEMHPEYRIGKAKEVVETEAFKEVKKLFIEKEVEPLFEKAAKTLTRTGFKEDKITSKIREGSVAEEIIKEAKDGGYDAVFFKGVKHELREKLLATVTDTIVHSLQGITIYVGGIKSRRRGVFSRILIPLDGSQMSKKAVKHVAVLAKVLGERVKKITLLHVKIPSADPRKIFMDARRIMEKQGVEKEIIEEKLREGDAAEEIIREAMKHETVVMGKRGLTKLQDLFLGSTSRKVLHSIDDQVLILVS